MHASESNAPSDASSTANATAMLLVILSSVGIFLTVALPTIHRMPVPHEVAQPIVELEELLELARDAAMATGDAHLVYFETDHEGEMLVDQDGNPALAIVARDVNRDGRATASELIASLPVDPEAGIVGWGSAMAERDAEGDHGIRVLPGWSFVDPHRRRATRWLMFPPDGMPRSFSIEANAIGPAGSGAGAIYAHSASKDYAVVVTPHGEVDVQHWSVRAGSWQSRAVR